MIEYIKNLINNLIVYITTSCQAKLTAGENVTIAYDETTGETIISASGGGGDNDKIYKKVFGPRVYPEEFAQVTNVLNIDDSDFFVNNDGLNKCINLIVEITDGNIEPNLNYLYIPVLINYYTGGPNPIKSNIKISYPKENTNITVETDFSVINKTLNVKVYVDNRTSDNEYYVVYVLK